MKRRAVAIVAALCLVGCLIYTNSEAVWMQYIRTALSVIPSALTGEHVPQEWRVLFISKGEMLLNTRESMVEQAREWVGLNEADGSFKPIVDTYNGHKPLARGYELKYTDEWCAGFASAVAIASGNTDNVPLEVSCPRMIQIAQNMGIWQEADGYIPKPADLILYDWDDSGNGDNTGNPDHVGIVESVSGGVITIIEGNISERVGRRYVDVDGRYIRGFITPTYKEDNEKPHEGGGKDEDIMAMNGIDISNYQRGLDLAKVPCDFVICKATEGGARDSHWTGVHNTCDPWIQQAKKLGKKWGFYHFGSGGDAIAEADYFVKNCANYFGEGIPVLDYEMYGRKGTAWAKRFLDRVYEKTKVRCMVYTSRSVLTEEDWSAIAPYHALWVAQYPNYNHTGYQSKPWFPAGSIGAFKCVTMHQYTSAGRLSGYNGNLDLDIAYLDRAGWDAIARGDRGGNAKPTPPAGNTGGSSAPAGSTLDLACAVMRGEMGNGADRRKKLGSRYDEVQNFINHINNSGAGTLANEVLAGKYGNGETRKTVLGARYNEVQNIVNGRGKKSIETVAREVIRGEWGNNPQRKQKLEAEGYDYNAVQKRVNQLM